MAYVSILVAASVSFVIIGSRLGAITTFPSFKVAFGGLPIKITGYLFGPLIGAVTGLIADIVSFALLPTYYHPLYSFIMAMSGFVPGVVMWLMVKKERKNNTHFLVTFIMLCAIGISTVIAFQFLPEEFIVGTPGNPSKLPIHNRPLLQTIASSGFFLWAIVLVILRFVKKFNKYIKLFAPIILFCSILEVNNSLMTPLADSLTLKIPFGAAYVMHMFTSPVKIISNVLIISATYKIVGPLVKNKMDNSYEGKITNQKIYVCGPTVYNEPHIGNLRPIITFDIFVRSLKSQGQKIEFIHNITDIDDKIIEKSIAEKKSEKRIAKKYAKIYMRLLELNNVDTVTSFPTVTKNMKSIIKFIEKLIKDGFAYESEGNVFFEVNKDKQYNSISNRKFKDMKFKEDGHKKKHPADFAIWKTTTKGITFKSPWGKGRPGWHTECATFIEKYQGVDVHGGGIDLLFPHHQNEASQFRVLNNKEITNEWKHVGPINLDGSKMSKSIGNVLNATDFVETNGNKLLRMLFLTSSVSSEINVTDKLIASLSEKISKFTKASKQAQLFANVNIKNNTIDHEIIEWDFSAAMKKLNANLKEFNSSTKDVEAHKCASKALLGNLELLGLIEEKDLITRSDKKTYKKWEIQKEKENYAKADVLRDRLINKNII